MTELLTGEDWYRHFRTFERTARRLETRDTYAKADEDAAFRSKSSAWQSRPANASLACGSSENRQPTTSASAYATRATT
jgi:hypothetical protein